MGRPQQPELNRSGRTPLEPDSLESELEARKQERPGQGDDAGGAVPEDNRPGHHPDRDQDKPDPDAFVERFGGGHASESGGDGDDTKGSEGSGDGDDTEGSEGSGDGDDTEGSGAEMTGLRIGQPVDDLLRELGDRIRQRDMVLVATYPIHVTVELLRYGRDRMLALR